MGGLNIIATRRRPIKLAQNLRQGVEPFPALHPELYRVRSAVKILPGDTPFLEEAHDLLLSRL